MDRKNVKEEGVKYGGVDREKCEEVREEKERKTNRRRSMKGCD